MKKIKLPRKRKKAIIKAPNGRANYLTVRILNELICEERGYSKNRARFPKANPLNEYITTYW